jgi:hypothetical protein
MSIVKNLKLDDTKLSQFGNNKQRKKNKRLAKAAATAVR